MNQDYENFAERRDERLKELKEGIDLADTNYFDIVDEATMYVHQNWRPDPLENPRFRTDFAMVLGRGYIGTDKQTGLPICTQTAYMRGDMHAMSHVVAGLMKKDPGFRQAIMHALEVFSWDRPERDMDTI